MHFEIKGLRFMRMLCSTQVREAKCGAGPSRVTCLGRVQRGSCGGDKFSAGFLTHFRPGKY